MKDNKKLTFRTAALGTAAAFMIGLTAGGIAGGFAEEKETAADTSSDTAYERTATATSLAVDGQTELTTSEIAQQVGPAVVGIQCEISVRSYFGTQTGTSSGSGIIISEDGYIATNYHVIEDAKSVKVILNSGEEIDAALVGGDQRTDLAVIKVESSEALPTATFGDSDAVAVGDRAVAIGNPMGMELFGTVTQGIISGLNRTIEVEGRDMTLIQTDAAINSGNSGGALINAYGEVIGINSAKIASDSADGLGFAIPSNEAVPILKDLIDYGYVKGRPLIGVNVKELTKEIAYYNNLTSDHGLYIMNVTEGSGAEAAGLQRGDIILSFDGKEVTTSAELNEIRDTHKAGDSVEMVIDRSGQMITLNITLTEDRS